MQPFIRLCLALCAPLFVLSHTFAAAPAAVNLSAYAPHADGVTDDTPALTRCFGDVAKSGGGVVTIPPGDYFLSGAEPVPLSSRTAVFAYGARFHLPENKSVMVSQVIAVTVEAGLIKAEVEAGSRKFARYIPFWA